MNNNGRSLKERIKLRTYEYGVFWIIIGFFISFIIILLSPFCVIRLVTLPTERIGHLLANPEIFLSERECGYHSYRKPLLDTWYYFPPISNHTILRMWRRSIFVWPYPLGKIIATILNLTPNKNTNIYVYRKSGVFDIYNSLEKSPPHLSLTQIEIERGREEFKKLGLKEDNQHICIFSRDTTYLSVKYPNQDWSYHDFRNFKITDYKLTINELISRKYNVIRMGSIVDKKLPFFNNKLIDYSYSDFQNELLEISIIANCLFFIGCGSGIDELVNIFQRPLVTVNAIPIEWVNTWKVDHIFIPKKIWIINEKRFMPLKEMIETGVSLFNETSLYHKNGLIVIDNSPEEIRSVAIEMEDRISGRWKSDEKNEKFQNYFRSIIPDNGYHGIIKSRIGTDFLVQNEWFLK